MSAPVFSFFPLFFAPTAFQFEQNTKVTVDIFSKGGAAGVYVYSKLRRHVYLSTARGNLVCAFHRTAVSASPLSEEWRLVIAPLKTHTRTAFFKNKLYIRSMFWLHRLSLILTVLLLFFSPRYKKTLPKTTSAKRQSGLKLQREQEKEQKWAGERWCARGGWESLLLKKSWDVT